MKTNILNTHTLMTILFLLVSSADASITVKTIEGEELLLYEQSYALVVGNCDYQNFIRLPGAKQDVEEVAKALERKGFIVELALNLTGKEFKTLFTNFALNRGNKENTRMLFYYAGHGATLPMAGKDTMGYLVMIDTPKPDKNRAEFVNKSVDMQYMVLQSQLMTARHVLYMFDSCFSGTILNFRSDIKPGKVSRRVKYPVRQFITAGSADEEVPDKSYFKQVFLDLIEGRDEEPFKDGYITGEELGFYLNSKVPYYFSYQHPQFGKIKNPHLDKGNFIFLAGGVSVIEKKIASRTGSLVIETGNNNDIEIFIYNASGLQIYQGYGKAEIDDLKPQRYTIIAKGQGYAEKRKSVVVNSGRSARVSFVLDTLKGRIYVDATPKEAQIRILHMKPKFRQGMELPPGRYELEASYSGYFTLNKWVSLSASEDLTVEMQLQPKERIQVQPEPQISTRPIQVEQQPQISTRPIQTIPQSKTFTNSLGMRFVLIPAGSFMMGSPANESGRDSDEIQHKVKLTKSYYMQTTEVTQGQWKAVMGSNPSSFENCGNDCPVESVSWNDVQTFLKKLNRMDRGRTYRLPTEAEWEYAARAGTTTSYSFGDDSNQLSKYGNFCDSKCTYSWKDNSQNDRFKNTAPVKSYSPNSWGLYDMHGNVNEWCQDWKGKYPTGSVTNPTGPATGSYRVFRGGSWYGSARICRSADRYSIGPVVAYDYLGFRLCAPGR
jgi:formylglycine-generating enzyme required for sulfatase activity